MKYAIIAISGAQQKIEEKQIITVDKLDLKEGDKATTDQVLFCSEDGKVQIGTPTVKKASVEYTVLKHYQGDKLRVFKYKNKVRYRKTMGFRAQLTDIQITKITF